MLKSSQSQQLALYTTFDLRERLIVGEERVNAVSVTKNHF